MHGTLKGPLWPGAIPGGYFVSAHLFTVAMGWLSGTDDSNGSTPKAALIVITDMKQPIRKKARVSVSGVSFIG